MRDKTIDLYATKERIFTVCKERYGHGGLKKIAGMLGLHHTTVYAWTGQCRSNLPDTENWIKLAELLGVEVEELIVRCEE